MKFLLDHLSQDLSPIHRLDARAKLAATVLFTVCVVSVPGNRMGFLFAFFAWPAGVTAAARLPVMPLLRRAAAVSPLILLVVAFNPFFEPGTVVARPLGLEVTREGLLISGGILVKFFACIMAMLVLAATTPFPALVSGLRGLGIPSFLTHQVSFLYRYLFILADQARRMKRARDARSCRRLGARTLFTTATGILGFLFVRTLDKGERIDLAMKLRGFDGRFVTLEQPRIGAAETVFLIFSLVLTAACTAAAHGGFGV